MKKTKQYIIYGNPGKNIQLKIFKDEKILEIKKQKQFGIQNVLIYLKTQLRGTYKKARHIYILECNYIYVRYQKMMFSFQKEVDDIDFSPDNTKAASISKDR